MGVRRRLDTELVRRGLINTPDGALDAIAAGRVLVGGSPALVPARMVEGSEPIHVTATPRRFVSRGGEKLAAALERFAVEPRGRRALDAGASSGGFTDCLLQAGAAEVVAVDVGRGQPAWALRADPRVAVRERTNVRTLEPGDVGGAVDLVAADLSFISLLAVAPALVRCSTDDADLVLLVKPQFEAGRARVGEGGVVRDPDVHRAVLREVRDGLATHGLVTIDVMVSPLRGADGNVEFLFHCRAQGVPVDDTVLDAAVDDAVGASRGTPMTVTRVGLVPHPYRPAAVDLAKHAAERLAEHGVDVRTPAPDADAAGLPHLAVDLDHFAEGLDVVVSLGGDGTMLRAVDLAYEAGVAVLGVNVGQLGYLTEIEPDDFDAALDRLLAGNYEVAERMVLAIEVESAGSARGSWFALNEAVLEKVHTGRLVRLQVDVNGAPFTSYAADGVIIATPTGSTAYSFSARGPIVSPRLRCLLLTPVSPHMLFDRSLVLAAEETLRFSVCDDRSVVLTLDGRELGALAAGDTVSCTGGPLPARIVTLGPRDFHQILKAKFGLADR